MLSEQKKREIVLMADAAAEALVATEMAARERKAKRQAKSEALRNR